MNQDNVTHLSASPYTRPQYSRSAPAQGNQTSPSGAPHKKFVAKGHDAQLMEAQMGHLPVVLTTLSGSILSGTITKRDKYTITLRHALADGGKVVDEIFYKHAIEGIQIERSTDLN
jgi:sRNA-binding regulator protein Hfq